MQSICQKIKEARLQEGMSPFELAAKADVDPWIIHRIEVSRKLTDRETMKRIMSVLSITE